MRNDRIPKGIRKEANRLSPGRYCDPATGRIYVDSADMDDAFEEMIDGTKNADRKRIAEYENRRLLPVPPPNLQAQAKEHLQNHALRISQNVEDREWGSRAEKRRAVLLGRKAWNEKLGRTLDDDEIKELAELDKALKPKQENEDEPEGTATED